MDASYMLACGFLWHRAADVDAGWELVEALGSPDPRVRQVAQCFLVESGEKSMELLEDAVRAGIVAPETVGPCMAELLRTSELASRNDRLIS